ncbi:MAG: helix-turn-helix domain-containing protein [Planctomycetota bacterium]
MSKEHPLASPMTVDQAATELGITPRAVRDLIHNYQLRAFDASRNPESGKPRWRITPAALVEFKERRENKPTSQKPKRSKVHRPSREYV